MRLVLLFFFVFVSFWWFSSSNQATFTVSFWTTWAQEIINKQVALWVNQVLLMIVWATWMMPTGCICLWVNTILGVCTVVQYAASIWPTWCNVRNYVAWTPADQYGRHLFSTFHENGSRGPKLPVIQGNWLYIVQFEKLGSEEFRWSQSRVVAAKIGVWKRMHLSKSVNYITHLVRLIV